MQLVGALVAFALCRAHGLRERRRVSFGRVAPGGADAETASTVFARCMEGVDAMVGDIEAGLSTSKSYEEGVLGFKFDEVFASGSAAFAAECEDPEARQLFEAALDARLELLYLKYLSVTRARLLSQYTGAEDVVADFDAAAQGAKRAGATWAHDTERAALKGIVAELKARADRATTVGAKAAAQQSSYMQLFQTYQAQIQQLQAAVQASPPQVALAYRVPDTDLSVSVTRQADRTTLTLGCVPDDSAPLLGPNGFVKGVTPANIGLTLNLHV